MATTLFGILTGCTPATMPCAGQGSAEREDE
jgi:hypothetical protein